METEVKHNLRSRRRTGLGLRLKILTPLTLWAEMSPLRENSMF